MAYLDLSEATPQTPQKPILFGSQYQAKKPILIPGLNIDIKGGETFKLITMTEVTGSGCVGTLEITDANGEKRTTGEIYIPNALGDPDTSERIQDKAPQATAQNTHDRFEAVEAVGA
ncbi:hypothetical protein COY05_04360 [Candidatus Peregrinibacteria bacterium CG_4_10_14_0_2_um_filter_38_24]|nr:MAG: hypothetical protein COY05_04360 [Candidatus Peregrinibacteria bacterium CG_4_10_14_0_2_um_filter_38_24]PJC39229.1 MAG: hypothetical protein CO044_00760 [Candidatus Peregrinibacteria bacterium CG_4_9_14_0_2_um_filter_38_9]